MASSMPSSRVREHWNSTSFGGRTREPFAATSPTDKGTPKKTFFQWFVHRGILWQFGVVLSLLAVMLVLLLVGVER